VQAEEAEVEEEKWAVSNTSFTPFYNTLLHEGDLILGKRYRIVQVIYQRPRLNLYLARRLSSPASQLQEKVKKQREPEEQETLVAIRELHLEGLHPQVRSMVEAAVAHESLSAAMPGSSLLESGNRMQIENNCHYLVMQLHEYHREKRSQPLTLAQLLLQSQWPTWLTIRVSLHWASQLCRSVACLHRLGVLLGNLSPSTLLVDKEGIASWAPVQLISWPPAPQFWQLTDPQSNLYDMYDTIFPIAKPSEENVFVAPELFNGYCDERSDVYSLGAILYLLLTRYAPASAVNRLSAMYQAVYTRSPSGHKLEPTAGLELTLPRFINAGISPLLEQVLLRALEVNRERRYQSVFELVEALEALDQMEAQPSMLHVHRDEGMRKLLRQIIRY
jgi:serine/threonine protein kinase